MEKFKTGMVLKKTLALYVYIALVGTIIGAIAAFNTDIIASPSTKFFYQNLSTALLVSAVVVHYLLAFLQGGLYELWTINGRPKKSDERQNKIRVDVVSKSYAHLFTIVAILTGLGFFRFGARTTSIAIWVILISALVLPSQLAAFRKDA
jgi:hypothetical protein